MLGSINILLSYLVYLMSSRFTRLLPFLFATLFANASRTAPFRLPLTLGISLKVEM